MKLESINIYPVKSMGNVSLMNAKAKESGLLYDRQLLLVDKEGRFITQRENQALTRIGITINGSTIQLSDKYQEYQSIESDLNSIPSHRKEVKIWKHSLESNMVNSNISEWIGSIIQQSCELAIMDTISNREKTITVPPYKTKLSFADGYPYLLISTSSLKDLNQRLTTPVPMNRFRPNMIVRDCDAFDEDLLKDFKIGSATFRFVKKCVRCIVTTIDQNTGKLGLEPLKTLATFRKESRQIVFGAYAICTQEGVVHVGDEIISL
jgi:uncharacterized protein YcbX